MITNKNKYLKPMINKLITLCTKNSTDHDAMKLRTIINKYPCDNNKYISMSEIDKQEQLSSLQRQLEDKASMALRKQGRILYKELEIVFKTNSQTVTSRYSKHNPSLHDTFIAKLYWYLLNYSSENKDGVVIEQAVLKYLLLTPVSMIQLPNYAKFINDIRESLYLAVYNSIVWECKLNLAREMAYKILDSYSHVKNDTSNDYKMASILDLLMTKGVGRDGYRDYCINALANELSLECLSHINNADIAVHKKRKRGLLYVFFSELSMNYNKTSYPLGNYRCYHSFSLNPKKITRNNSLFFNGKIFSCPMGNNIYASEKSIVNEYYPVYSHPNISRRDTLCIGTNYRVPLEVHKVKKEELNHVMFLLNMVDEAYSIVNKYPTFKHDYLAHYLNYASIGHLIEFIKCTYKTLTRYSKEAPHLSHEVFFNKEYSDYRVEICGNNSSKAGIVRRTINYTDTLHDPLSADTFASTLADLNYLFARTYFFTESIEEATTNLQRANVKGECPKCVDIDEINKAMHKIEANFYHG